MTVPKGGHTVSVLSLDLRRYHEESAFEEGRVAVEPALVFAGVQLVDGVAEFFAYAEKLHDGARCAFDVALSVRGCECHSVIGCLFPVAQSADVAGDAHEVEVVALAQKFLGLLVLAAPEGGDLGLLIGC